VKNEEILKQARDRLRDSESAETDNRATFQFDTHFENGEGQWSDDDKAQRVGRPCITINKVAGAVKQITGSARRNRPRVKIRPVDSGSDIGVATLFTGIIRNIENVSDAEAAYDKGYEDAVRGGYGYWRILTDYADDTAFDQDISIERIVNPAAVYMDQSATKVDYSDIGYAFIVETMSQDKFDAEYPKAKSKADFESSTGEEQSGWFAAEKVRVAEYFYKEKAEKEIFELVDGRVVEIKNPKTEKKFVAPDGINAVEMKFVSGDGVPGPLPYNRSRKSKYHKIMWCKMNGQEILEGPSELPGKYIPIVPCLGDEIWIDGKRVLRSAIRHSIDAQKLYNWARSNMVETLAQAPKQPYHVTPDEIEGHEKQWNEAHIKPQAYRLYNDVGNGRPQPSSPSIPNTGAHHESMIASDDIKATTNIYDASLGASGNETSGKAIGKRQNQSSTASYVFVDNQAKAIKYTAKILVDLIPRIYDTERVVRLLNEDGSEAWAKINEKNPVTGQVLNDLSVGRYDVTYDVGPDFATRREEAAEGMLMVAQTAPQFAPVLIPKIAQNLDWPGAQELGQQLEQANQPQPPPPEEQAKTEAELQIKQLEVQGKAEDNRGKEIDNHGKELEIEKLRLEIGGKGLDNVKKTIEIQTPPKNTG